MKRQYPQYLIQLFAKAPVPGQVKTRMLSALSSEQAAQLHRALTSHACNNICNSELCDVELWTASDPNNEFLQNIGKKCSMPLRQQVGKNLGDKMLHAAKTALKKRSGVILVGADCPFIDGHYLRRAVIALEQGSDVVLGPASDGGYVLLGLGCVDPLLFSDIEWGSDTVLDNTLDRIKQLHWSCTLLEERDDIDRPDDLQLLNNQDLPEALRQFAEFS